MMWLLTVVAVYLLARWNKAAGNLVANWEQEWSVVQLTDEQQKDGLDLATSSSEFVMRTKGRQDALNGKAPAGLTFYTPVDFADPRMEPLCRLNIVSGSGKTGHCSCSFIKPQLIITAAHCLSLFGVTGKSGHALYAQQQYGRGGAAKEFGDFPIHFIKEWWYPKAFNPAASKTIWDHAPYDVAFMKTTRAGTSHYDMLPLFRDINFRFDNVAVMGYPENYFTYEIAVLTTGKIDKDEARMLLLIHNDDSKHKKASMSGGGSGGPIILSTAGIAKYKAKKAVEAQVKMALLSVIGKGDDAADASAECQFNVGVVFTEKLIKAANHIDAKGTAQGAKVGNKNDKGEQAVSLTAL